MEVMNADDFFILAQTATEKVIASFRIYSDF